MKLWPLVSEYTIYLDPISNKNLKTPERERFKLVRCSSDWNHIYQDEATTEERKLYMYCDNKRCHILSTFLCKTFFYVYSL